MKKLLLLSIALSAIVLWAVGCGGGGGGSTTGGGTPTGPSNPTPTTVTVNIVSSAGSGAFTPNPVQAAPGAMIEWRNSTAVAHTLAMNDGTAIGTVGPNASITRPVNGGGGDFRCTTHPSMVGSINGAVAPTPPPGSGDGY